MARYDGARNGLLTAVWFLLLAAIVSLLGAWWGDTYDFFDNVHLPQWFSENARTAKALATGLLSVAVMVLAGFTGGVLGARYHRRADELIVHTRRGGIARDRGVEDRGAEHRGVEGRAIQFRRAEVGGSTTYSADHTNGTEPEASA
jgi:hypothetical protein